jgi:magnesium transporter
LTELRRHPPTGRILYFYVADSEGRLRGVVPTRRLVLSAPETPLADIMVREVVALPATATVLNACEFFTLHRFLAFPVVDDQNRIIGTVDVELYTRELGELETSRQSEDLFQLIGVHLAQAAQSPVLAFRSRFPWLLCNIGGGILAAFVTGLFEAELQQVVALALFIPVVLSLAESVSVQSVSLALQALHGEPATLARLWARARREAATGLLLGVAAGSAVAFVALIWIGQRAVAFCVLAGIGGGVLGAAVVGVALPNLLRLARRDPRVAAGPIALATADLITLLVYFNCARWLLG